MGQQPPSITMPHAAQDSLKPVDVSAQVAAMSKGRNRVVYGAAGIAILLAIGGFFMLFHLDRGAQYANAANALTTLENEKFEGYFGCVLPGSSSYQLTTTMRLRTALERAGDRLGKRYGATLQSCETRLDDLSQGVAALPLPGVLSEKQAELSAAVEQLDQAQAKYQRYLNDDSSPFEHAKAAPLMQDITNAWEAYRTAHGELSQALNEGI